MLQPHSISFLSNSSMQLYTVLYLVSSFIINVSIFLIDVIHHRRNIIETDSILISMFSSCDKFMEITLDIAVIYVLGAKLKSQYTDGEYLFINVVTNVSSLHFNLGLILIVDISLLRSCVSSYSHCSHSKR